MCELGGKGGQTEKLSKHTVCNIMIFLHLLARGKGYAIVPNDNVELVQQYWVTLI